MTAEEIYHGIRSMSVTQEVGISLIENYGIRKQREVIKNMQKEFPGYSNEIEKIINEINENLDTMLNKIVRGCEKK